MTPDGGTSTPNDADVLIRLTDVSAGYDGKTVLSHASLSVTKDSFIAVVGPNGGGKTTLVRVLLGQLRQTHGSVWRATNLSIGYMPQVVGVDLDFPISVRDVVMMGDTSGTLRATREMRERADELIEFAQLGAVADRQIGQLSGGQRQRVMLCRALMMRPKLLVLDEPVTYMDRQSETTLYNLLPVLQNKMAIVLVSHDVGTVAGMAKTIAAVDGTLRSYSSSALSPYQLQSIYGTPLHTVGVTSKVVRAQ